MTSRSRRPAAARPHAAAPQHPGGVTNLLSRRRTAAAKKSGSHSYSLLLKDSTIYGGGRMLQKFLTALMLPLFTAFLTKADYGIVGMVVTVTTFLDVFVTLGFDVAFTRFYFDDKDPAHRRDVITHVFYVKCLYPALLLGGLIALMPWISSAIMGGDGYTIYFDIGVATLFFTNLSDLPFTLMRLEHRPWTFTSFTVARVLIQVPMAVVFLAVFDWGPAGYLGANLVTAVILNIAALPFYAPRLRFLWDRPLMRSMLAFAIPAMFTAISFFFLKLSDRFFLLNYQGIAVVGLYTVATSLSQPLYIVGMAFRMAWPQWHYAKLNEPEKHKHMVSRSSTYFMAFNGALLVLIGFYLPLVIHVLLNEDFWSVGPTTFVLTLSVALYNLYFIFWIGANVAKKNRLIPVITIVASAVNIGLNFLLVPQYGMWAAAWTHTLGFGILAVLVYFVSNRYYPIPYEWRRLVIVALATALTLGAGWAIGWAMGVRVDEPLADLIVGSLAMTPALLVFPLVLWATRFFTASERARIARLMRRRRTRQAPAHAAAGTGGSVGAAGMEGAAGGAGLAAAGAASTAAGASGAAQPPSDHGDPDRLSPDDLEAEEEEVETEAEVDIAEGGNAQV
jgi:O-antigen/teichoic acid export membrane protein